MNFFGNEWDTLGVVSDKFCTLEVEFVLYLNFVIDSEGG
jgi:hypothetical protein